MNSNNIYESLESFSESPFLPIKNAWDLSSKQPIQTRIFSVAQPIQDLLNSQITPLVILSMGDLVNHRLKLLQNISTEDTRGISELIVRVGRDRQKIKDIVTRLFQSTKRTEDMKPSFEFISNTKPEDLKAIEAYLSGIIPSKLSKAWADTNPSPDVIPIDYKLQSLTLRQYTELLNKRKNSFPIEPVTDFCQTILSNVTPEKIVNFAKELSNLYGAVNLRDTFSSAVDFTKQLTDGVIKADPISALKSDAALEFGGHIRKFTDFIAESLQTAALIPDATELKKEITEYRKRTQSIVEGYAKKYPKMMP
jgi:hypothetical protein